MVFANLESGKRDSEENFCAEPSGLVAIVPNLASNGLIKSHKRKKASIIHTFINTSLFYLPRKLPIIIPSLSATASPALSSKDSTLDSTPLSLKNCWA